MPKKRKQQTVRNESKIKKKRRVETIAASDGQLDENDLVSDLTGLEDKSLRLFKLLDCIGYSREMIDIRRAAYRMKDAITNAWVEMLELPRELGHYKMGRYMTCGSKGEGLSKLLESDTDSINILTSNEVMLVLEKNEITTNRMASSYSTPPQAFPLTSVLLHQTDSHPGYCLLEVCGSINEYSIGKLVIVHEGKQYLSSKKCLSNLKKMVILDGLPMSTSGPAVTFHTVAGTHDYVPTIESDCRDTVDKWASRLRRHDWPHQFLREIILGMNGNLVPVGLKGSSKEYIEWRYCFNEIELLLVNSFNDTQKKLYKTLKCINQDFFQKHGLTSYIIKNIVYWIAEENPQSEFRPDTLFKWVVKSLQLLRQFISEGAVPYYMIPERNLLIEKVAEDQRDALKELLDELIPTVTNKVFECESLKKYVNLSPVELDAFKEKMDNIEQVILYYEIVCDELKLDILKRKFESCKISKKSLKAASKSSQNILSVFNIVFGSAENINKMIEDKLKSIIAQLILQLILYENILFGWPLQIQDEINKFIEEDNYDGLWKLLMYTYLN